MDPAVRALAGVGFRRRWTFTLKCMLL